jgi:hypothetical protein
MENAKYFAISNKLTHKTYSNTTISFSKQNTLLGSPRLDYRSKKYTRKEGSNITSHKRPWRAPRRLLMHHEITSKASFY